MNRPSKLLVSAIFICLISAAGLFAQENINNESVIEQIEQRFKQVDKFKADFKQKIISKETILTMQGQLYFKGPFMLKMDFKMTGGPLSAETSNMFIYNGSTLWQQQSDEKGQQATAFKSVLPSDAIQAKQLLEPADLKQQFKNYLDQYNVIGIRKEQNPEKNYYVISMEIKPEVRGQMVHMFEARGADDPEGIVLEKISYYWDIDKQFVCKVELESKDQTAKTQVEYSNVQINPEISDEIFEYQPKADVEVIDMTDMVKGQNAIQEYEAEENKMAGEPFPDFELQSIFDDKYDLEQFDQKVLIVSFWEQWCGPCLRELPLLESLYQDIYTEDNAAIITITTDKQAALETVEDQGYSLPVLIDEKAEMAKLLQVRSIPRTFVVDKQGVIAAVYIGFHQDIKEILSKQIKKLNPEED
jgi:outer membrane lipoprotein-sorting protein/peroxiredoxin